MVGHDSESEAEIPIVVHNESDRAVAQSTIFTEETTGKTIPAVIAWELNERTYGELQSRNKDEMKEMYGADQVKIWRRSYDVDPPKRESLAQSAQRAFGYFMKFVEPQPESCKNVLIAAYGNSLRSTIMYLDKFARYIIELEQAIHRNPQAVWIHGREVYSSRKSGGRKGIWRVCPDW